MNKRELAKTVNRSAAELAQVAAFARGEDAGCLPPASAEQRAATMVAQARAKKGTP